jgi:inorganic pyrophosphatase/K(+)-stimulated pyrophosphate-energized sodium pump
MPAERSRKIAVDGWQSHSALPFQNAVNDRVGTHHAATVSTSACMTAARRRDSNSSGNSSTRWLGTIRGAFAIAAGALSPGLVFAQEAASEAAAAVPAAASGGGADGTVLVVWLISLVASIAALVQAWLFYKSMMAADAGTPRMIEIAGFVREGANAYLRQQYKVVAVFFIVIFFLLAYAAFGLKVQSNFVPFAFLTGGFFSGLAGWFGMKTATQASNRTAAGARKSLNQGLQIAFRSGAVMGLTVVGLGLIDITLWFGFLYWVWPMLGFEHLGLLEITVTMLCFGMGASSQALFARVGGGIFTKAADVGADLVGKVEHSIPEDDPRNPATIADNVGDNVGDVAGMGADLYESYCGAVLATAALGVAAFSTEVEQLKSIMLPLAIAGVGTLLSIFGIYAVRTEEDASQRSLLAALARGINLATILIIGASIGLAYWLMPDHWMVSLSVIAGLVAGWLIGKWTEYSTSNEYRPTKELADQALTGPATVIIGGIAEGMLSTWAPVVITSAATIIAFGFGANWDFADPKVFAMGLYGVGIAAVGMLSTLGITLATDAYGPIADNAGGNAQMAELEPLVRERTDALDALGNTTAATGKGFAIGSAALTALALLAAYIEEVRVGFDRWADSIVVASAKAGDVVKIGASLAVKVGETARANEALLVIAGRGDKEFSQIAENAAVSAELLTKLETQGRLIAASQATMADYMRYYDVTLMNPLVLVGAFLGSMATFLFCALTMKAVGRAAKGMVEEVRRQFRENKGIMAGTSKPDYAAPVAISTKAAQREMILPSLLALAAPVVIGLLLGVAGVMGLLVGSLTTGFCLAVFMANAGGAWDNAKKHIEGGAHGGKGTEAHKATVVGDTVGDPFKDTSGPSLNILIKLMSMVSVVVAGLVVRYSLIALGIL